MYPVSKGKYVRYNDTSENPEVLTFKGFKDYATNHQAGELTRYLKDSDKAGDDNKKDDEEIFDDDDEIIDDIPKPQPKPQPKQARSKTSLMNGLKNQSVMRLKR